MTPPPNLSDPTLAWWQHCVQTYEFEPHSLHLLELACHALDRHRAAQEAIARYGVLVPSADETLKPNPATIIARDSATSFQKLLKALDLDLDETPI
jgi:phage terminase small subunit